MHRLEAGGWNIKEAMVTGAHEGGQGCHRFKQRPAIRKPGGMVKTEFSSECHGKSGECFEQGRDIISHMFVKDYF